MFRTIDRLIGQSKWPEALAHCERLLQEHPNQAKLHGYAGLCLFQMGRYVRAVEFLKSAVILDDQFWQAGTLLAQSLDRLLRFEEALEVVEQFLKVKPSDPTLTHLWEGLQRNVPERITDAWQKSVNLDRHEVELTNRD